MHDDKETRVVDGDVVTLIDTERNIHDETIDNSLTPIVNNGNGTPSIDDIKNISDELRTKLLENNIDLPLPPASMLDMMAQWLAHNQSLTAQELLIHRIAHYRSVERLMSSHGTLLSMLLQIAEELNIVLVEDVYPTSVTATMDIIRRELNVTAQGSYTDTQLAHISFLIRNKVKLAKSNEAAQIRIAAQAKSEVDALDTKIKDLNKQLEEARKVPPALDAMPSSIVLFYRDKNKDDKDRTNYIAKVDGQYKPTRMLSEALTFFNVNDAYAVLEELLTNTAKHLVTKSYLVEFGKVNLATWGLNVVGQEKFNRLAVLKGKALDYETEAKSKGLRSAKAKSSKKNRDKSKSKNRREK